MSPAQSRHRRCMSSGSIWTPQVRKMYLEIPERTSSALIKASWQLGRLDKLGISDNARLFRRLKAREGVQACD